MPWPLKELCEQYNQRLVRDPVYWRRGKSHFERIAMQADNFAA